MRRPAEIPGIDRELLAHYPADTMRALGERLGLEDARAGSLAGPEYVKYAVERLVEWVPGFSGFELTAEETHEFVCGLVIGLDDARKTLKIQ